MKKVRIRRLYLPCFKIKNGDISLRGFVRANTVGTKLKLEKCENDRFVVLNDSVVRSIRRPYLVAHIQEIYIEIRKYTVI